MGGRFITFEGIDGCGKTTMMALVQDHLARKGIPLVSTREPGGTSIGETVRQILLRAANRQMTALTELLLYAADRAQHVDEVILPALHQEKIVLSDRFADATLAYQGYGRGFDLTVVRQLIELATHGLRPDLTIVLDLEVEEAQARLLARRRAAGLQADRLDAETMEFHQRVRQGYWEIARSDPERVSVIDARGQIQETSQIVIQRVLDLIDRWKAPARSCL